MSRLKTSLIVTFNNLGGTKRTAPPKSQDPIDEICHEFKIAEIGRQYFNDRYDVAKIDLVAGMGLEARDNLEKTKATVKKTNSSSSSTLAQGEYFSLIARVNPGASFVDMEGLKQELQSMFQNLDMDVLVRKHTKRRSPTVTYIVAENE